MAFYIGLITSHNISADCPPTHNEYGFPLRRVPCQPLNETNHVVVVQYNGFTAGHMINSYHNSSLLLGYTHSVGNWQLGVVAATGYTDTPMANYTVAGLLLYPTIAYNLPLNEHIALTAVTAGIVNNFGLTISF